MSAFPRHRTVADLMTTRVHVAGPLTPFKLLVRLIEENRISAVPVVDQQGVPVGVVSESDLLLKERRSRLAAEHDLLHVRRHQAQVAKAEGLVAADLMTSPPITVSVHATVAEAAKLMQESNVKRLVVVDARGKIAGIVSRSDLLQVFLRTDEELREEILVTLVPKLVPDQAIGVDVRYNIVTLHGEVDRKSDVEILGRVTHEVDGVVDVNNELTYRWDDTRGRSSAGPWLYSRVEPV